MGETAVYLEIGSKRVIAAALAWPGWLRSGRTEEEALDSLSAYAPRYARVAKLAGLPFDPPASASDLIIAHRLPGNSATDFGAMGVAPPGDEEPLTGESLERVVALLNACWAAFDAALDAARGKELSKGPRGGGRDLEGIRRHVIESEGSYSARIGLKLGPVDAEDSKAIAARREAMLDGMAAIAPLGVPPPGPRGGARWSARYFGRVVAYHVVDHIWEVEDRSAITP
jgi:hypothetical protein